MYREDVEVIIKEAITKNLRLDITINKVKAKRKFSTESTFMLIQVLYKGRPIQIEKVQIA